jgi:hypothetical protein
MLCNNEENDKSKKNMEKIHALFFRLDHFLVLGKLVLIDEKNLIPKILFG